MPKLSSSFFPTGIPTRASDNYALVLTAATAKQFTVPAGMNWVRLTGEMIFYALFGANPTAAIPAADVTDGTASTLVNTERMFYVGDVAKIGVIARAAGVVQASYWQ